jgi:hypothetical protein
MPDSANHCTFTAGKIACCTTSLHSFENPR